MYDTIDSLILEACEKGEHPFNYRPVYLEANRLAKETHRHSERIIDGRLTALKRQGQIIFQRPYPKSKKRWMIKEA